MEESKFSQGIKLYGLIEDAVMNVLKTNNLLNGQWQFGEVAEVISQSKLKVYANGSDIASTIHCNPDITFNVGDHVLILKINGHARDRFVLSRRLVG